MILPQGANANPWFGLLHAADVLPLFALLIWMVWTTVAGPRRMARSTAAAR